MKLRSFCLLLLLLCFIGFLLAGRSRGGSKGSIFRSRSRSGSSRSFGSYNKGLSKSRKKALFFGAGALAGVYIGSRMRSHVHLRSYRDLYDYEVCEGTRIEFMNSTGMERTYSYFICPDDPNQPFERYCCRDPQTGMGVCCSYDEKHGATVGGVLGTIVVATALGLCCYCCCCKRRRRKQAPPPFVEPQKPVSPPPTPDKKHDESSHLTSSDEESGEPYTPIPAPPLPSGVLPYPPPQNYGFPDAPGCFYYTPQPPVAPGPVASPGSAWGAPAPSNMPPPNDDPPPYPGYGPAYVPPTMASAPSAPEKS